MIKQESLFRTSVFASLLFHVALFGGFYFRNLFWAGSGNSAIEIDLTKPFRIGGNPLLMPGGGNTLKEIKKQGPQGLLEEPVAEKKSPPKDWVLPGSQTRILEKPVPAAAPSENKSANGIEGGTLEGYQGTGDGFGGGEGEGGGIPLSRFPKLLNRREILRLLRRNYPSIEREAGRNGEVIVDLHLDAGGQVTGVEVVGSAGSAFDGVAQSVARKMKFSPAMMQSGPVAVKIRQAIVFKLEEEE
jgi:TonB family protein